MLQYSYISIGLKLMKQIYNPTSTARTLHNLHYSDISLVFLAGRRHFGSMMVHANRFENAKFYGYIVFIMTKL